MTDPSTSRAGLILCHKGTLCGSDAEFRQRIRIRAVAPANRARRADHLGFGHDLYLPAGVPDR